MAHARGKRTIQGWSYVGGGDYLHGVPARNLTVEEYDRHAELIQANADATGRPLYVPLTKDDIETPETGQGDDDDA